MNYTSTRGTVAVNETYALLHGLAEDGGLYVPSLFPTNCLTYNDVKDKNYQEVAAVVLAKLFPCFSEAHLNEMINSAYSDANFSTRDIAPNAFLVGESICIGIIPRSHTSFQRYGIIFIPLPFSSC